MAHKMSGCIACTMDNLESTAASGVEEGGPVNHGESGDSLLSVPEA